MGLRLECALCRSGRQLCRAFRALAFRIIAGYKAQARRNSVVMSYPRACVDSLTPCRPTDGPCISVSYGYCGSSFRMQTYCLDGTASQLAAMANAAACTLVASPLPRKTAPSWCSCTLFVTAGVEMAHTEQCAFASLQALVLSSGRQALARGCLAFVAASP